MLMFPIGYASQKILPATNRILDSLHLPLLTLGEFLKYLGIRLQGAFERNRGPFMSNWDKEETNDTLTKPGNYGERFGMSRDRFKNLTTTLRLAEYNNETYVDTVSISLIQISSIISFS